MATFPLVQPLSHGRRGQPPQLILDFCLIPVFCSIFSRFLWNGRIQKPGCCIADLASVTSGRKEWLLPPACRHISPTAAHWELCFSYDENLLLTECNLLPPRAAAQPGGTHGCCCAGLLCTWCGNSLKFPLVQVSSFQDAIGLKLCQSGSSNLQSLTDWQNVCILWFCQYRGEDMGKLKKCYKLYAMLPFKPTKKYPFALFPQTLFFQLSFYKKCLNFINMKFSRFSFGKEQHSNRTEVLFYQYTSKSAESHSYTKKQWNPIAMLP